MTKKEALILIIKRGGYCVTKGIVPDEFGDDVSCNDCLMFPTGECTVGSGNAWDPESMKYRLDLAIKLYIDTWGQIELFEELI